MESIAFVRGLRVRSQTEARMRNTVLTWALAVVVAVPASAQDWTEYKSVRDGFQILFLGQPRVIDTTWKSQAGFNLPSRVGPPLDAAARLIKRDVKLTEMFWNLTSRWCSMTRGCPRKRI